MENFEFLSNNFYKLCRLCLQLTNNESKDYNTFFRNNKKEFKKLLQLEVRLELVIFLSLYFHFHSSCLRTKNTQTWYAPAACPCALICSKKSPPFVSNVKSHTKNCWTSKYSTKLSKRSRLTMQCRALRSASRTAWLKKTLFLKRCQPRARKKAANATIVGNLSKFCPATYWFTRRNGLFCVNIARKTSPPRAISCHTRRYTWTSGTTSVQSVRRPLSATLRCESIFCTMLARKSLAVTCARSSSTSGTSFAVIC
jgi:hypothetical protein